MIWDPYHVPDARHENVPDGQVLPEPGECPARAAHGGCAEDAHMMGAAYHVPDTRLEKSRVDKVLPELGSPLLMLLVQGAQ